MVWNNNLIYCKEKLAKRKATVVRKNFNF